MAGYIRQAYRLLKQGFRSVIHTRRLIISSEKRIVQFTIGVPLQVCAIMIVISTILWSSYATGHFVSARVRIEEQNNTIRAVVTRQLSNMFTALLPSTATPIPKNSTIDNIKSDAVKKLNENYAKLALLEQQVNELKTANEVIVERVRLKTSGKLDDLETIISQTGLDPYSVKKQSGKYQGSEQENDIDSAEGGPYIPTEMPKISDDAAEMLQSLDDLQTMKKIVANLPLGLPIKNAEEHSRFGHRVDPFNGNIAFHSGLDLVAQSDPSIRSTGDGIVTKAENDGAYGNMVDIDHGFGISTRYGHLSAIKVQVGDKVAKGDIVGIQGSTGRSTGAHLHYEVRYKGTAIDPQNFIQTGRLMEIGGNVREN